VVCVVKVYCCCVARLAYTWQREEVGFALAVIATAFLGRPLPADRGAVNA
jgi:hypothetical protein